MELLAQRVGVHARLAELHEMLRAVRLGDHLPPVVQGLVRGARLPPAWKSTSGHDLRAMHATVLREKHPELKHNLKFYSLLSHQSGVNGIIARTLSKVVTCGKVVSSSLLE